jgi:LuxR family maltose regulon positive regulatory protein
VIESPIIHQGLAFLLDHLPACLHLLLASRVDPPLPLARMRGRGVLVEIRDADLRCTPDEAGAFLTGVMGLPLLPEQISALEQRTDGWMAGLQMAALSLQGRDPGTIAPFITAFSGSHRHIVDYLADEVLRHQSAVVQAFLLRTSVLDRLCAELCTAVLANDDARSSEDHELVAQTMLEHLERANLFVIALDDERQWYRYHHLFSDVLRHRLGRAEPGLVPVLHRRAAAWYETQGSRAEAIHHCLAARDYDQAARLIETIRVGYLPALQGWHTLLSWVNALPEPLVRSRPLLCALLGTALMYSNQFAVAELRLQDAEQALSQDASDEQRQVVLERVALTRTVIASFLGDIEAMVAHASQALASFPAVDAANRAAFLICAAYSFLMHGEAGHEAEQAIVRAGDAARASDNAFAAVRGIVLLGWLYIACGRLGQSLNIFDRVFEVLQDPAELESVPLGPAYFIGKAAVLLECNEVVVAQEFLSRGLDLCRGRLTIDAEAVSRGYIAQARLLYARGDRRDGMTVLDEFAQLASERRYAAHLVARGAAVRAQLLLAQGDLAAARRWVDTSGVRAEDELSYPREAEYLTLARVRIAQARAGEGHEYAEEAQRLLERMLQAAETGERMGSVIEIQILRALALQAMGDEAAALTALARALSLAEPEGYVRIFVAEGQPMVDLLRQAPARGIAPGFVASLLAALGEQERHAELPSMLQATAEPAAARLLAEQLSERERDVLRLLAAGLSNQEIARRLYVEVSTVKTHLKSIYSKLDAHGRAHAVARARELQVLPA